MSLKINAVTDEGGAVELNAEHHVWASFAVAGVADLPRSPSLHAGLKLPDGRRLLFFHNRDNGITTVEVVNDRTKKGVELLRTRIEPGKRPAGNRFELEPLEAAEREAHGE